MFLPTLDLQCRTPRIQGKIKGRTPRIEGRINSRTSRIKGRTPIKGHPG